VATVSKIAIGSDFDIGAENVAGGDEAGGKRSKIINSVAWSSWDSYNWQVRFERSGGILLHPTSLPGCFGIGDLGDEAYRFVDFLAGAGQKIWQVLPLGPTGYGDSPYQCFSAFAGNPVLVSLERLAVEGFLSPVDLQRAPIFPYNEVAYGRVIEFKLPMLQRSFHNFTKYASSSLREEFDAFCHRNLSWLDDYALFMALKSAHGEAVWTDWPPAIVRRKPAAIMRWSKALSDGIHFHKYVQFQFFKQWTALKSYCHERGIKIMGDIPIYVAHDSADVWAHPEMFHLDERGHPTVVAGVPPDYFSETGQLWGNPLYRWDMVADTGYRWWIERFRATLTFVDIVRLDHFRGFEAYWEVPADEKTAVNGRWVKGPGAAFFETLQTALGELPIVAENLGMITPEVEALREQFGFPGMAVLQFAFGGDPKTSSFLPHNYERNLVVYTGTHDNDTVVGWWTSSGVSDSTRTDDQTSREKEFAAKYLDLDNRPVHWAFIRAVLGSVADAAIIPLQDVFGLGSDARMNLPARAQGNWRWRFRAEMLTDEIRERLRELTWLYGRA
jgi:4-alpha-glucanotransferase